MVMNKKLRVIASILDVPLAAAVLAMLPLAMIMARLGRLLPLSRSILDRAGVGMSAPSMGAILEVKVLPRADHSERNEVQLREGDRAWEGSME
jgi:hypothetical protein